MLDLPKTAEELDQAIHDAVEDLDGLSILAVFGSRAQGTARPDSDLDVAILPESEDSRDRWKLQGLVSASLSHLAADGRVDVVILDEAPELLRHQIFSTGRAVLCRDLPAWKDLRVRTMREHGDREYYRKILRQGLKRRILERSSDGGE